MVIILSITSITLSAIGIIGYWIISNQIQILTLEPDLSNIKLFNILQSLFIILYIIGIISAFISLFIKKSKLALIAGLIPCLYSLVLFINNCHGNQFLPFSLAKPLKYTKGEVMIKASGCWYTVSVRKRTATGCELCWGRN